jgi:hypothetical protein
MADHKPQTTIDYREIYSRRAEEYDRLVTREDYRGNILQGLAAIRPLSGLKVVELGAGTGRLGRAGLPSQRTTGGCRWSMARPTWSLPAGAWGISSAGTRRRGPTK